MALYVVIGPPAAGKSTWIRERAQPGDVVIDYDLIATALAGPHSDGHTHRRPLATIAFRAREAAITEALRHVDALDVYVIHSIPQAMALNRYRKHGAQVVTVDPGREVVEARCRAERPNDSLKVVERWYARRSALPRPAARVESRPAAEGNSRAW